MQGQGECKSPVGVLLHHVHCFYKAELLDDGWVNCVVAEVVQHCFQVRLEEVIPAANPNPTVNVTNSSNVSWAAACLSPCVKWGDISCMQWLVLLSNHLWVSE